MLNTIGLREVALEEYQRIHDRLGLPRMQAARATSGFAEVTCPLSYSDYKHIIIQFYSDDGGDRASVNIRGGWIHAHRETLDPSHETYFNWFLNEIELGGFVQLSFKSGSHHYIQFQRVEDLVMSVYTQLPGSRRNWYIWQGSDRQYEHINAMYVPGN